MEIRIHADIAEIDAAAWDALVGDDDPFVEHGFLNALELSGSVGEHSGWRPLHLTAVENGLVVGALPLYLKEHSYGEYIFDWGWASAAERAGIPYYPKLVSMVPMTPATGRRFLVHPKADRDRVITALLEGVLEAAELVRASSVHLLFLDEQEISEVRDFGKFAPRLSMQYHWHAAGDASFDDYLSRFRSSMRKQVRRERRAVKTSGLRIVTKAGAEITSEEWGHLGDFYRDTCEKKGSIPYLEPAFFDLAAKTPMPRAVAVFAYEGNDCIAGTLNFEKGQQLYGRYWGCTQDVPMLHFELCYYQLIERAIEQGVSRFEAGAQGVQKLRRGLMPSKVHSAHWIRDPRLDRAVREFLGAEAFEVMRRIEVESQHGPFRRDSS